jgi:hypothetical protein
MPYASQRNRTVQELEFTKLPWPAPPLNVFMTSGYERGIIDIQWDDPTELALNSRFRILGVNIYRSFDSEYGPFQRITDLLVGSRFWRDRTDNELVDQENVTQQFVLFGACAAVGDRGPRYVFKTRHWPIVKPDSQQINADTGDDIRVYIDGREARVLNVWGSTGEVEIDPFTYTDVTKQSWDPSLVPAPTSTVTCTYRYTRQLVRTDLAQRIHYRATCVGIPIEKDLTIVQPQDLIETPIEHATSTHTMEMEKLDWIWREAINRNRWIAEQGGERVKVFLRKNVGIPCPCFQDDYHKQPFNDDRTCFGTGIVGGYDGPYDIIIAPPDADLKISQKDKGRTVEQSYEAWTGPSPLLAQRDFCVKINGDRYSFGGVRMPTNRGNVMQQHFNLNHIDEKDIRSHVPVTCPVKFVAIQFKPTGPELEAEAKITNKPDVPQEQQLRGRTPAWENIEY